MSFREILKMVLVLTIVTGFWGGALSLVYKATKEPIEFQRLKNIKEPALKQALTISYTNNPIKDRISLAIGHDERGKPIKRNIFIARQNGKKVAVALETFGSGYEGDIGVMVAILLPEEEIGGIAVTKHSETQGVGTKAIQSQEFKSQFINQPLNMNFSPQGGAIDAVSGATYTSEGIQKAVQKAVNIYKEFKQKIP